MSEKLPIKMIREKLQQLHIDWSLNHSSDHITRSFKFDNYIQTIAFANSVACIAHQYDHHPDMLVTYNTCNIDYSTHSARGLSDLDFICARSIDSLVGSC